MGMKDLRIVMILMSWYVRQVYMGQPLAHDKIGPFKIVLKHIDDCSTGEHALLKFHIRSRKVSRTSVVLEGHGTVNASVGGNLTEITDDFKLKNVLQKFTPSGWKDNFLVHDYDNVGCCTLLKRYLNQDDVMRWTKAMINVQTNESMNAGCPIYSGEYTMAGVELSLNSTRRMPKKFFYGQYRNVMHINYLDGHHEVGCVMFYLDLIPKTGRS